MMRRAIKGLAVGSGVVAAAFLPIVLVMTLVAPDSAESAAGPPRPGFSVSGCTLTLTTSGQELHFSVYPATVAEATADRGSVAGGSSKSWTLTDAVGFHGIADPNGRKVNDWANGRGVQYLVEGVGDCPAPETTTTTTTIVTPDPDADIQAWVDCDGVWVTNQGTVAVTVNVGIGEGVLVRSVAPGSTAGPFDGTAGHGWGVWIDNDDGTYALFGNGEMPTEDECRADTTTTSSTLPPEDPESSTTTTSPPAVDDVTPTTSTILPRSVSERDAEPCGPGLTGDGVGGCWAIVEGG